MTAYSLVGPTIDFVFKRIFGSAEHPAPLLNLTNAIFEAHNQPGITAITVLNPVLEPEHLTDKGAVLDIKAKSGHGEPINIEMQAVNQYDWEKRSLYYWSRLFAGQLTRGGEYKWFPR